MIDMIHVDKMEKFLFRMGSKRGEKRERERERGHRSRARADVDIRMLKVPPTTAVVSFPCPVRRPSFPNTLLRGPL